MQAAGSTQTKLTGVTSSGIPKSEIVLSEQERPGYSVAVPDALNSEGFKELLTVKPFASAPVMLQAIVDGDDDEFKRCLHYCSAEKWFDVDDANAFGQTCLHIACKHGNIEAVTALLATKADPFLLCKDGYNALSYACRFGGATVLPILAKFAVGHGCHIQELFVDDNGDRSQVALAATGGHADCIVQLAAWKADVNAADRLGQTPCHHAARGDHATALRVLHASKADLEKRNTAGKTPLMTAGVNRKEKAKVAIVQLMSLL